MATAEHQRAGAIEAIDEPNRGDRWVTPASTGSSTSSKESGEGARGLPG